MRVCALIELMALVCKQEKNISDSSSSIDFSAGCMLPHLLSDRINSCVTNWQMGGIVIIVLYCIGICHVWDMFGHLNEFLC